MKEDKPPVRDETTYENKNKLAKWEQFYLAILQPGSLTTAALSLCLIAIVVCKILNPEIKENTLLAAFYALLVRSLFGTKS